jgi:hypothetical protein
VPPLLGSPDSCLLCPHQSRIHAPPLTLSIHPSRGFPHRPCREIKEHFCRLHVRRGDLQGRTRRGRPPPAVSGSTRRTSTPRTFKQAPPLVASPPAAGATPPLRRCTVHLPELCSSSARSAVPRSHTPQELRCPSTHKL